MSALFRTGNVAFVQGAPENGGFEAISHPRANLWGMELQAISEEKAETPERLQNFFANPTQWWDDRRGKGPVQDDDSWHNKPDDGLRLKYWDRAAWVGSWPAVCDFGLMRPSGSAFTRIQGPSGQIATHGGNLQLEVGTCRKLCEDGQITEAINSLNLLVQRGCQVPNNLFYLVLRRCIAQKDLVLGRRIHALSIKSGYEGNAFLATHLIGLYASHGRLTEAMRAFSKVSTPDAYNWASIILACARHGQPAQAIALYRQMRASHLKADNRIFVAVLKACASAGNLSAGKDVHANIVTSARKPDVFVQNSLVDMYAKCGSLEDARRVFDKVSPKDVVTWTVMIAGYAQQGMGNEALRLYSSMQQEGIYHPDAVTFVCLLQACASAGQVALQQGMQLHAQIEDRGLQDDLLVGGSLVNMYAKLGSIKHAQRVFDRLPKKNVVTWTAMITGYTQQGMGEEALDLYNTMQHEGLAPPDSVTFVCLLHACASVGVLALHEGKRLHAQIEQRELQDDVVVGVSLVNMYAKCGSLENAQQVFDRLPLKNVVAWTAMIAGYAQQGMGQEALRLYSFMQQEGLTPPNSVTFVCLLQACGTVSALPLGKQLHAQIEGGGLQDDVVVGGSLVNMYAKCGSVESAQRVFDRLPEKNVLAWNAMIAGYAQQGMALEALSLYSDMQQEGVTSPNPGTFVCLLHACTAVAALPLGKQLHAEIEEQGLHRDAVVGPSLVNMYAKCGSLQDAQSIFDSLAKRDIVAWSALIAGYTRQGDSEVVFDLLDRMRLEGVEPDSVTLLSVLTACSHMGLVEKGREYFEALSTTYGISPTIEHYTCMMDLLGRAGHLDEALGMAKSMPFQPNAAVWLTVLGACQKWNNVEVGRKAFEHALSLDETDASAYILMSNIYEGAGMWEEAKGVQARRRQSGAWKQPGLSWWTDMAGVVHAFGVGDGSGKHAGGSEALLRAEILQTWR